MSNENELPVRTQQNNFNGAMDKQSSLLGLMYFSRMLSILCAASLGDQMLISCFPYCIIMEKTLNYI